MPLVPVTDPCTTCGTTATGPRYYGACGPCTSGRRITDTHTDLPAPQRSLLSSRTIRGIALGVVALVGHVVGVRLVDDPLVVDAAAAVVGAVAAHLAVSGRMRARGPMR